MVYLGVLEVPGAVKIDYAGHRNTNQKDSFSGMRLVQSLQAQIGACWCMKLSPDGRYLATAGQDTYVNLWMIMPARHRRGSSVGDVAFQLQVSDLKDGIIADRMHPIDEAEEEELHCFSGGSVSVDDIHAPGIGSQTAPPFRLQKIIDQSTALQTYRDHIGDVIDMSWSPANFLLTASVDKTVRLWHVSRYSYNYVNVVIS